jgi:hypothetical protein
VILNTAELKPMWEGGWSQPEMLRKLEALGARVSKGTLSKAIVIAVAAGSFDPALRAAALARRGGLNRGGRRPSGGTLDRRKLFELWEGGLSLTEIAEKLSTDAGKMSRQRVSQAVRAALASGELNPAARAPQRSRRRSRAA